MDYAPAFQMGHPGAFELAARLVVPGGLILIHDPGLESGTVGLALGLPVAPAARADIVFSANRHLGLRPGAGAAGQGRLLPHAG